jgi:transcriptional regulator with XRE-family HTH domain
VLAEAAFDDAAAAGEVASGDPITADAATPGLPLVLFDVHAASNASATKVALVAIFLGRNPVWRSRMASRLTGETAVRHKRASGALAIASSRRETVRMAQNFDLGEFIREQRRTAQISVRQLAKLAGVSNPYLSQIERGLRRPSAEIMQQIAKGLRISAEALYVQAGILDERVVGGVVIDAIIADPTITERQKQVMVEVYDSFRKENLRRDADEAAASRAQASAANAAASGGAELDDPEGTTAVLASAAAGHSPSGHSASGHSTSGKSSVRTTMSRSTSPRRPR